MPYQDAPACKLIATHCCACGRPLLDAVSVENGIGPVCREKYLPDGVSDENRDTANRVIRLCAIIAHRGKNPARLFSLCNYLDSMGYTEVARKIRRRFVSAFPVQISVVNDLLEVRAPYDESANQSWFNERIRWEKARRARICRLTPDNKQRVMRVLKKHYRGDAAFGPKGSFVI